jgi:hypothetical protein
MLAKLKPQIVAAAVAAVLALLCVSFIPQSAGAVAPGKLNSICLVHFNQARTFDHNTHDAEIAVWEVGIAKIFTYTASDLGRVGARALAGSFGSFAAAHRQAAVAYDSGRLTAVNNANARVRRAGNAAISASNNARAATCAAFVGHYR